jgi:hypothetical protein
MVDKERHGKMPTVPWVLVFLPSGEETGGSGKSSEDVALMMYSMALYRDFQENLEQTF